MFQSHAQNFEDVILWRALGHVENGFYVDIGACDPVIDSVSASFYQRGWRGIHVEPVPAYAKRLRAARPDETVIEAAISADSGPIALFEFADTGLTTAIAERAAEHEQAGRRCRSIEVATRTLACVLDAIPERPVHWLKIDVEGMEATVLASWGASPVRPWVVVVESTRPNSPEPSWQQWEPLLAERGYAFVYFDGLNRFYLHGSHADLRPHFGIGPNVFDSFELTEHSAFCHTAIVDKLRAEQANAGAQLATFDTALTAKHADLVAATTALAAAREEIGALVNRQAADEGRAVRLEANLAGAQARAAALEAHVATLGEQAHALAARLDTLEAERTGLETAQAGLAAALALATARRLAMSAVLAGSAASIRRRDAAAALVARKLAAGRDPASLASVGHEIDRLMLSRNAALAHAQAMEAKASAILHSRSWRLTAPLRHVASGAKRLVHSGRRRLKPALGRALALAWRYPVLKSAMLAVASPAPRLHRRLVAFGIARPAPDPQAMWSLTPDPAVLASWRDAIGSPTSKGRPAR